MEGNSADSIAYLLQFGARGAFAAVLHSRQAQPLHPAKAPQAVHLAQKANQERRKGPPAVSYWGA
jgi:hypothetical protein